MWPNGSIIVQYLATYINGNFPKSIKKFQSRFKIVTNTKYDFSKLPKTVKNIPHWRNFAKSGHTGTFLCSRITASSWNFWPLPPSPLVPIVNPTHSVPFSVRQCVDATWHLQFISCARFFKQRCHKMSERKKERKKEREREMYRNIDKKQKERNTFIVKSLNRFKTFTQN